MQVIEYVKERILSALLAGEILHVVDNQSIYALIECEEVVYVVVA